MAALPVLDVADYAAAVDIRAEDAIWDVVRVGHAPHAVFVLAASVLARLVQVVGAQPQPALVLLHASGICGSNSTELIGQPLKNRDVGRGQVTPCDLLAAYPGRFVMSMRDWRPGPCLDPIGEKANREVGVVMLGLGEQRADRHAEAEFLGQLASKTDFGGLARLDLTAR